MKPVTKKNISEIAQIAGVSKATVSRVINNAGCVRSETRDRVLRVIEQYGYIPSETARGLSKQDTRVIGLVFPDLNNPFYYGLLQGITEVARQYGFSVLMFYTDENAQIEKDVLRVAKGRDLSGLIITAAGIQDAETAELLKSYEQANIPVVLLDRKIRGTDFCEVLAENEEGSYQAVKELLRQGHKKIAIIEGDHELSPVFERAQGYKRALREAGLEIRPEYIVSASQKSDLAYAGTQQLLKLPDPPTAIFSTNNMTTLGALKCLTEQHLKIGEDISIIGFDDIDFLNIIDYGLSVVDRSEFEMGTRAMEAMIHLLNGDREKALQIPKTSSHVILRGSEKNSRLL